MLEHQPHRPNYAELKNAAELVQEQQQDTGQQEQQNGQETAKQAEAVPEPTRPETVNRSVNWPDRGDMVSQQTAAAAQAKANNERLQTAAPNWVMSLQNPEFRQKREEQFQAQQNAAEHEKGNEGPEHTGGTNDNKR